VKEDRSTNKEEKIEGQGISFPPPRSYDNEVELIDYLRVLWKFKSWIIGITLLSVLVTLIISFVLPSVWEVSIVFEPGRFGSDLFGGGTNRPTGKLYLIDTAENVKAKIKQGSYDFQVRTSSGWPPDKKIKWDVNVEKETSAIRTALEVKDKTLGLKALDVLARTIEEEQKEKIGIFQKTLEHEMLNRKEEVSKFQREIDRVKTDRDANLTRLQEEAKELKIQIALLKQRESELFREEEGVRKNTELLMTKRSSLMESERSKNDPLALVLFTTSLQQNIAYSNQLASQLNDIKRIIEEKRLSVKKVEIELVRVKEDARLRIKKLESDIQQIEASVRVLEEQLRFVKPLEIIQQPTLSYKPVKPKKILNVAIAGILALFFSISGVFLMEYISGKKEKVICPPPHGE
jgi:LPS O-antigen subunit length determinant protein (WzzB/FepE family)